MLRYPVSRFAGACFASMMVLSAQTADVNGRVTDASGAAIPQAALSILNKETGVERSATSNDQGLYFLPLLQPGKYVRRPG